MRDMFSFFIALMQGMLPHGTIVMNTQWAGVISVGDLESSIVLASLTVDGVLIEAAMSSLW